jgi:protein phosphatase 1 regulatory subunit 11
METAARGRPSTASPPDGSRTVTITNDPTQEEVEGNTQGGVQSVGTLKLRGGPKEKHTQRVAWNDDVVDNEFFGKKKSKSMSGNFLSIS